MARRFDSADDLLCLTGSQVGIVASSARQRITKTPGRPNSSSGLSSRTKPSPKKSRDGLTSQAERAKNFTGSLSAKHGSHGEIGDTNTKIITNKPNARSDYLDFFDNPHQPKIIKPKQTLKSNTKTATTKAQSQFTHSVFQPVSARTVSTVDDLELSDNENAPSARSKADLSAKNTNYDALYSSGRFSTLATEARDADAQNQNLKSDRNPTSTQDTASSAPKFQTNGVANNMTSQALLSGNKAPLRSMENAYQNIKHKTPVNQVRQKTTTNLAEDYIKTCNMSAIKIQRCFRRWRAKRRNAEDTVQRLLESKRQERELAMANDKGKELSRDAERKKVREEKARQARQIAIQDLQKRREEKRQFQQKAAEEEISFLQANGRISKTSSHKSSNIKKMELTRSNSHQMPRTASNQDLRQRPGSSAGQQVDGGRGSQSQRDIGESRDGDALPPGGSVKLDTTDSSSTTNQNRTKTTIDDILETLKKLEADEESEGAGKNKASSRLDWLDELEKNEYQSDFVENGPLDDQPRSNTSKDNVAQSGLLSEEKLSNIMNYLEKMEANERLTDIDLELQKVNEMLDKPVLLVPSSEEIAQMELASQTASEVTQKMLKLKLELEDRKRKVQTLEKALNQQRDLTVRYAKETESEMKKRVDAQRSQFDIELSRRNVLIDQTIQKCSQCERPQEKKKVNRPKKNGVDALAYALEKCLTLVKNELLEDKKQWAEKYDSLQKQLITVTQTSRDKIKSMEESHAVEVKKLTDLHSATDKLRREKWVKEETKRIKEMTVKGFEPELQRLISQHKSELNKIKATHQAELMVADERAAQRYVQMTEELRDQLAKEKEAACARERELARQMYEKQVRQEEEILQQQRQRLYIEVREEKERIAQTGQKQRHDLDRQQQKLEETQSIAIDTLRKEYELARKEQESRHATEVRQLKEQLTIEKEAWEENYRKKQETMLMQKEREMREQVKKDRDREIEMAIRSLADDRDAEIKECKKDAENQIRRIREKYERELTELERSERQIAEKYNQTKAKLHEVEGENERLKVTLTQRELHANELKSLLDKRNEERNHISDVIRQEFADRIVAIEDENRRLKNEVSELKARHRLEVERLKSENEVQLKSKEDEMEEVHRRVKEAIAKKDKQSEELVKQRDAAVRRADYAEQLLIEQGKKLLGKK